MLNEIERKFFVKQMPDLSGIEPLHYERYFLSRANGVEERISKVNEKFVYEKKTEISSLERSREKKEISEQEFNQLKEKASEAIIRDRYNIPSNPEATVQIYHGKFEGLIRAEVEFKSEEEAKSFVPFSWMGKEMTELPIARDSKLLDLTNEEFQGYLK
jgi:CYTH domain-containing protein